MRRSLVLILLSLVASSSLRAEVFKKDLRAVPIPTETFVAFCAARDGSSYGLSLVRGDRSSGFEFDQVFMLLKSRPSAPMKQKEAGSAFDACSHNALSSSSALLVLQLDPVVYKQVTDVLSQFVTSKSSDYSGLEISIGQVTGISLPTSLLTPFDFTIATAKLNRSDSHDGAEWIWQPPTIGLQPLVAPVVQAGISATTSSPASPMTSAPSPGLVDTGLDSVRAIDRKALEKMYQAIADAEDNPNVSYNLEVILDDDVVTDIFVHAIQMKRDQGSSIGDALCVYLNSDAQAVNAIEVLNTLLNLSSVDPDEVSRAWGFNPKHPLLGTPRMWQAAVTNSPACFLNAVSGANLVADSFSTGGIKYASTLIRNRPVYPGDTALFNQRAPLVLHEIAKSKGATPLEQAWLTYRSFVDQTLNAAEVRSGAFPGLGAGQIKTRRTYYSAAATDSGNSRMVRSYVRLREIGWHEFQANKYKGMRDDVLSRYDAGVRSLYDIAASNSRSLQKTDIAPSLISQTQRYQELLATSVVSKVIVTEQYDPKMTHWGRVCELLPLKCAEVETAIRNKEPNGIEWKYGDKKSDKWGATLQVDAISTGSLPDLTSTFGGEPVGSKCFTVPAPPNPLRVGVSAFEVNVRNTSQTSRELSLAHVGSFIRASWKAEGEAAYESTIEPGASKTVVIEFVPTTGYEDLNMLFLMENGVPIAELTVDYVMVNDPALRLVDIDSGNVEGANGSDSTTYDIGLGKAPLSAVLRKACVWLSGDRVKCEEYSSCKWKSQKEDAITATFTLQGHDEAQADRRLSIGHLRVAYQLVSGAAVLQ